MRPDQAPHPASPQPRKQVHSGDNFSLAEAEALKYREDFETKSVITQYYLKHDFNYFDL
jgi:hypothetical protein